jgi:uncharacterized glyoxalase superfamily protein PhnB
VDPEAGAINNSRWDKGLGPPEALRYPEPLEPALARGNFLRPPIRKDKERLMKTMTKKAAVKTASVKPVPAGFHTITATLVCKDAAKAMAFYKKALGATEVMKMTCPETGLVMHGEMKIGDSIFFLANEMPAMGCMSSPTSLWLYVDDCDAAYKKAVKAGATAKSPLMDMFWGDRMGQVTDPYGHVWTFATHTQNLTDAQIAAGQKAFYEQMKAKMQGGSCS